MLRDKLIENPVNTGKVDSLKDVTSIELRTGDHCGIVLLKEKGHLIFFELFFCGTNYYIAHIYKEKERVFRTESDRIVEVKREIKEFLNSL